MGTTKKGRGKGEAAEDFSFQVDLKGIPVLMYFCGSFCRMQWMPLKHGGRKNRTLQMGRFGLLITGNQTGRRY